MVFLGNVTMEVNYQDLFQLFNKLGIDFVKKDKTVLKYFYLMMPKKTCNCPNKPKVQIQSDLDQAYDIFLEFKKIVDLSLFLELKANLNILEEINFIDKDNNTLFKI